jgi:hypothetical protein
MTSSEQPSLDRLAAGEIDETDGRTLGQLASMYSALDPVPRGLVERVQFGITLDALNAELAQLQRSDGLVGVRSDATDVQTVTFASSHLTAMVTVTQTSADVARIDGWITPPGEWAVELRTPTSVLTTDADADGRFVFEAATRGFVQFTIRAPGDSQKVITPSIEI